MPRTAGRAISASGGRLRLDTVGVDAGGVEVKLLHEAKDTIVFETEEGTFSKHQELGVASWC